MRMLLALGASAALVACHGTRNPEAAPAPPAWQLVWHDEFDEPALDTTIWAQETGGDGWGNAELEYYTDHGANTRVESGQLVPATVELSSDFPFVVALRGGWLAVLVSACNGTKTAAAPENRCRGR